MTSTITIDDRFRCRRGTAADLASVNPIPLDSEIVLESDTGMGKIGDGATHYNDLLYRIIGDIDLTGLAAGQIIKRNDANDGWLVADESGGSGGGGVSPVLAEITKASGAQSISTGLIVAAYDTVIRDPLGWFSAADNGFIVDRDGSYSLYAATSWGATKNNSLRFLVNGASKIYGQAVPGGTFHSAEAGLLYLNAGDLVQMAIAANATATASFDTNSFTFRLAYMGG